MKFIYFISYLAGFDFFKTFIPNYWQDITLRTKGDKTVDYIIIT